MARHGSALLRAPFCASAALLLACSPLVDTPLVHIGVRSAGHGRVEGAPADTTLYAGTRLRLTAVPDSGFVFTGWGGIEFTNENPLDLRPVQDLVLEARFAQRPSGTLALIRAAGTSFLMGSSGAGSGEYEHPVHTVRFGHDFYLGRCEVTQAEYAALMGSPPGSGAGAPDVGDSFPAYNVSWYDAALYCNRRSVAEGYDTVYSYTSRCGDPACPWVLENLAIHYDRFGYRLPTEAEWEYACRAGSSGDWFWGSGSAADGAAASYAWYFVNSRDRSNPVARLKPNAFGLYDMAGNLAEWVNDWLDFYADSAVTDPVGPAALLQERYESQGERPLRGGSWRLGTDFLRSSCRKGPYRTSAFAAAKDIGFRVALGTLVAGTPKPIAPSADTLPVRIVCDKTALYSRIGTNRLKMALAVKQGNRWNLAWIDFSAPGLSFRRCGTDSLAFGPVFSPDGNFVSYSSQGEGFSGPGTLSVRRCDSSGALTARTAGCLPHFWASPETADTFLLFTDGTSLNNQRRWYAEKTYRQRISGGVLAGTASVLWRPGSYHGGLSSDGRFLGTSYPIAKLVDLQLRDSAIAYFLSPWNGRDDNPQICNLSMSPSLSEPGEALLLDFGYPRVSTLLGRPYGMHAVIFICTARLLTSAHVSGWFEKPSGYDQWDFPRWSNHSGFIVSLARTSSGGPDAVYVINRKDSTCLKVAEGTNLSCPALWIDPSQVPETNDPYRWFGSYDVPVQWAAQAVFAEKLRLFWHCRLLPRCIIVGSSPSYYGVNPRGMKIPALNIAACGTDAFSNVVVARDYVLPHAPQVKAIVFDLTPGFLDRDWRKEPPQLIGLYDSKGYELDARNNFYRSGLPPAVAAKAAAFGPAQWSGFTPLDSNGYEAGPIVGGGWGKTVYDRPDYNLNDSLARESLSQIAGLADSAAAKGVHLLIVNFPEHPDYATSPLDLVGRYGPSRTTYAQIVDWINALMLRNRYVHFYDANNYGRHDFTDSEALDCNHLNARGGMRLGAKIDSVLGSFGIY